MRQNRAFVFFGLAAILGGAAILFARDLVEPSAPAAAPSLETVPVVIARADIPTGSALQPRQLQVVTWPAEFAPKFHLRDLAALEGRVVRRAVVAGEPILEPLLMPEGTRAGLVSVIDDKKRAVSVKVDPVIGVAGFVTPGSRVDVLATLRRVDWKSKLPYAKVILQDVPVLAIDQKLEESRDGTPELVSVVTLAVAPEDAEKLIYGAHEGRLQLALRGAADREVVKTASIGVSDLLRREKRIRSAAPGPQVEVFMGTEKKVKQF